MGYIGLIYVWLSLELVWILKKIPRFKENPRHKNIRWLFEKNIILPWHLRVDNLPKIFFFLIFFSLLKIWVILD